MGSEYYKQQAMKQIEILRYNPPFCPRCKIPMMLTGEEGGWSDKYKLYYKCTSCGQHKTITVEWGWSDRYEVY